MPTPFFEKLPMLPSPIFDKLCNERHELISALEQKSDDCTVVIVKMKQMKLKVKMGVLAKDERRAVDRDCYLRPTDDEKIALVEELMRRCKPFHYKISKRYGGHIAEYFLTPDWKYWYSVVEPDKAGLDIQIIK